MHIRKKPKLSANAVPTIFDGFVLSAVPPGVPLNPTILQAETESYVQEINMWSNEISDIKKEDTNDTNEQQFPDIKLENFDELDEVTFVYILLYAVSKKLTIIENILRI